MMMMMMVKYRPQLDYVGVRTVINKASENMPSCSLIYK